MKRLLCSVTVLIMFMYGCGVSRVATIAGKEISESYSETATSGKASADTAIEAWPYISGLIKGALASNYNLDMPQSGKDVIEALDSIYFKFKKGELTDEDRGLIIGYVCRIEYLVGKEGWDRYGASITAAIRAAL